MSEENKKIMRRIYEEAISNGNYDLMRELVHADCVSRDAPPNRPQGLEADWKAVENVRSIFSDLRFTVEDVVAEGDKVVARVVGKGTHSAEFMGTPATGKEVTIRITDIGRIEDGKLVEHWESFGMFGVMMQIGAWPPAGR